VRYIDSSVMKYVDAATVHELRTVYHYGWKEVAEELGMSVSTLERWRLKSRYGDRHERKLTFQQVVSGLEDWAHENKTRGIVESHTWAKVFLGETVTRRQVVGCRDIYTVAVRSHNSRLTITHRVSHTLHLKTRLT
jgi:hypothetical protein